MNTSNQQTLKLEANAKINLGLAITGRLPNGYHTLSTNFIEVDFADKLSIELIPDSITEFSSSGIHIPGETNICIEAVELLRKKTGYPFGVSIHLEKVIPIGAGLGGGSSDAAAVLKALNQLWNLNFSANELKSIAVELGADVPFFIDGGIQYGSNIGDQLTPLDPEPYRKLHILLVFPDFQVSTVWAYGELKKCLKSFSNKDKFKTLPVVLNWQFFENDFEQVIVSTYPEAGEILAKLRNSGALLASLSGSGSTMFGIYDDKDRAREAQRAFDEYNTSLSAPALHAS